jgi:hypothetical protein
MKKMLRLVGMILLRNRKRTEENHAKGFKWSKKAADKDDAAQGMGQCADC